MISVAFEELDESHEFVAIVGADELGALGKELRSLDKLSRVFP